MLNFIVVTILGLLEITAFAWVLKYIFVSLVNHQLTMLLGYAVIVFLLWLGQKLNNMAQSKQGAE